MLCQNGFTDKGYRCIINTEKSRGTYIGKIMRYTVAHKLPRADLAFGSLFGILCRYIKQKKYRSRENFNTESHLNLPFETKL